MDRMSGLEVFVLAVQLGGISAAARRLGLSPTMAARHLCSLEDRLGVSLLHRTTRKLSLTEAGAGFYPRAGHILEALAEAEAEAASRTVRVEGVLRVSVPTAFGMVHIVPRLAAFSQRYPEVTVELGLDDRFVDLLQERWEMAVRIGTLADSSLIARRLAPARLVICAAPSYLALHGVPRRAADLADHACLGYSLAAGQRADTWRLGRQGEIVQPVRGALIANNGGALVRAAIEGLGLVLGPRFLAAAALADGTLTEVTLDVPLPELGGIYAVTHPARVPAAKTRAFIDFLAEVFVGPSADW